jgi:SAM-dependent methyltransferase
MLRARMSDAPDTKQAEKAYLRRSGSLDWERAKPFAPPGHDMVAEAARLIHEFAVALNCLAPSAGQRVLDLGAGACWTTEWLCRLQVRAVAVDIATDMLRVGATRDPRPNRVAGDLESLPFAAASFDHAMCLNAYHHLPDGPAALRELVRVVRPGGRVVFAEPGLGHANAATSKTAVDRFGVLEQDIVVSSFAQACADAGFVNVRLVPVAYVIPWYTIDRERWLRWETLSATARPVRAMRKMWNAAIEVFGAGKNGPLFQDALGMDLVRLLKGAMEHHPIVLVTVPPK